MVTPAVLNRTISKDLHIIQCCDFQHPLGDFEARRTIYLHLLVLSGFHTLTLRHRTHNGRCVYMYV